MAGTVLFLGAGAAKSCGGPMTNEILPAVLSGPDSSQSSALLRDFLGNLFHVNPRSPPDQFSGLPLVMSLLDTALDRRQALHPQWDPQRISDLRQAIELRIFDLLEEQLYKAPTNNHWELLRTVYPAPAEPRVITTNYDLIIDTAMMFVSDGRKPEGGLPDYRIRIGGPFAANGIDRFGTLLKLHGSLNWLYCRTCQHIQLGASESRTCLKVLARLVCGAPSLEQSYTADGSPCPLCSTPRLRPLLIAPTHLKDYRNPHLAQVWFEAERALREADRAVFIGYSLPDDDVEVVYLLKRGLAHLTPDRITVVEYDATMPPLEGHTVGRRYRTLFGDGIHWHPEGLDGWIPKAQASTAAPVQTSAIAN
jgi:NAD-dependent SIR2 family protein deacetylase